MLLGKKLKLLDCQPTDDNKLVCVFDANGAKLTIVAGVNENGNPQLIRKTSDKPVDVKLVEDAVQYTLRSIKVRRGEFVK